jgi:hypothetical protein
MFSGLVYIPSNEQIQTSIKKKKCLVLLTTVNFLIDENALCIGGMSDYAYNGRKIYCLKATVAPDLSVFLSSTILNQYFLCGADGFEFFFIQGL